MAAFSNELQRTEEIYKNNKINSNCAKNILEEDKIRGNVENTTNNLHNRKKGNIQTHKHTDIQTYKHTNIQTYKHTNIQTYRHTNIQTQKHTNIQTYKYTNIQIYEHNKKVTPAASVKWTKIEQELRSHSRQNTKKCSKWKHKNN